MWIFRDELVNLEVGSLRWLERILSDSYLNADLLAGRFTSDEEAFESCVQLLRATIDQWMIKVGADAELERLLHLTNEAVACDPLQEVFAELRSQARSIYRMAPRRKVSLHRQWRNSHPLGSARPNEFPDQFHLTAQTRVRQESSAVDLQVHLDEFGVPSFLVIPALLTHELVCHAYAGEDRSDAQSIWAEGVMDWAAIFFFERWCIRLGWPYPAVCSRREELWGLRMTPPRFTGHDAARRLVQWFALNEPSIPDLPVAQQTTARLVVEVNATTAPLMAKETLASRIANIRGDRALQDACRRWRNGADVVMEMLG